MRKYIGYGYTNSQGIATLDYDANGTAITPSGYLGTGGGEIDIQAELHDDSSIVSEPYSVWDTLFFDDGVTSPKTATWVNYSDRLTVTVDGTGTLLTNDNPSVVGYYQANNPNIPSGSGSSIWEFNYPVAVEFDLVSTNSLGNCGINFEKSSDNRWNFSELGARANDRVKIVYDGTHVKSYLNGSTTASETFELSSISDFSISLYVRAGYNFKFKDLKIYSI